MIMVRVTRKFFGCTYAMCKRADVPAHLNSPTRVWIAKTLKVSHTIIEESDKTSCWSHMPEGPFSSDSVHIFSFGPGRSVRCLGESI